MTETHTPYQRGRRAAERGAPRKVPSDVDFGTYRGEWLEGFDSIHGTASTRGAHYQAGQFQAWDVSRYLSGDMAQAWQYVLRCGRKGSPQDAITDLRKGIDFLEDYCAHPVPVREVDPDVRHRVNCLLFDLDASEEWKVPILDRIFMADTYVGEDVGGNTFHGPSLIRSAVIPAIQREIARREAA